MPRTRIFIALAALALAACVDNGADTGLTLLRNIAPATNCVIATDSSLFIPSGVIQADSVSGYLFTPVARNDLVLAAGEFESSKVIFVEGARVTIGYYDPELFSDGEEADFTARGISRFIVPASGGIDPDGGLAAFLFEIVPTEMLVAVGAKLPDPSPADPSPSTVLDVKVQIFGRAGGGSIESNQFRYPVEVCQDCLVSITEPCAELPINFEGRPGGACNPLQDSAVDCCFTAANERICPATASGGPQT